MGHETPNNVPIISFENEITCLEAVEGLSFARVAAPNCGDLPASLAEASGFSQSWVRVGSPLLEKLPLRASRTL